MRLRCACLIVFSVLIFYPCIAQQTMQQKADSLRRLLATEKYDTVRGKLLSFLSEAIKDTDSAGAVKVATEAVAIQTKHRYPAGIALAYFGLGNVYARHLNHDMAEECYKKSQAAVAKDTSVFGISLKAKVTGNLARLYGERGNQEKELEMTLSIIPMFEQIKDTLAMAVAHFNVAGKLFNVGRKEDAYKYCLKSIELHRGKPSDYLTEVLIVTAWCAKDLDSLDRMKYYLGEAGKGITPYTSPRLLSSYYTTKGIYHLKIKDYPTSTEAFQTAVKTARTNRQYLALANALEGLGEVYVGEKRYAAAKAAVEEYLAVSRHIKWASNILNGLKKLSGLEEKTHHYREALQYLNEYVEMSDSVREDEAKVRIHNLEIRFQAAQKEKKILLLENDNKKQQLSLQRSRFYNTLLLGGLIMAALTVLLLYIIFRNRRRITLQRERLQQQELERIQQEQRLKNFAAMVEGQEYERNRLARDLHDGLGGTMAGIRLKAAQLARTPAIDPSPKIKQIVTQLDNAIQEMRSIAHNLMPESLLKLGLEAALNDLCEGMQHNDNRIIFQAYGLRNDIPQSQQIMIYRLVQELVSNAVKHADAKTILVQCVQNDHELSITVEDDGKGFDVENASGRGSMGLISVKTRVDYLKGKLDVQSKPGEGTTVNVEVWV